MSGHPTFNGHLLAGRTILVTGATSGIGAATARALTAVGARVLASGRDEARLAALVADLPGSIALPAALDEAGAADKLAREALEAGDVDGLVNCAGFGQVKASKRFTEAEVDRHFAVNVRAPMLLAIALGEAMKARRSGAIVNLSSVQGAVGTPHQIAYASTKGAVDAMTRALARELGPHGIRVNAVAPGLVATEMWGAATGDKAFMDAAAQGNALRLWATPQMIADTILFLLSDAAAFIAGEVIVADGGFVHTGNLVPETAFGRG